MSKTRFLAAASHDILQPLNAARLYVTSLVDVVVLVHATPSANTAQVRTSMAQRPLCSGSPAKGPPSAK